MKKRWSLPVYSRFAVFAAGMAIIGVAVILVTRAATPVVSTEAEQGTVAGSARVTTTLAGASGSSAVQFGAATPTNAKPTAANTGVPAGTHWTLTGTYRSGRLHAGS